MKLSKGNAIVLNRDNKKENTQKTITTGNYTYLFTISEIALLKVRGDKGVKSMYVETR